MKKLLILLVLLVPVAYAYPSCSIKTSCSSEETAILSMTSIGNGHAGIPSAHPYKVCCDGFQDIVVQDVDLDSNNFFISLSSETLGHAQSTPGYGYDLHMTNDYDNADCIYDTVCPEPYICAYSISGATNAHVGACGNYTLKACCGVGSLGILIRNLGLTGIERSNPEYTSVPTVYLDVFYEDDTVNCRYTNFNSTMVRPPPDYPGWTKWETCISTRVWTLDNSSGLKVVYAQMNNSGAYAYYNDTIYYDYTGGGLDTTAPSAPSITDGDYTNDNRSISIRWQGAYDPESDVLNIPLTYEYILYKEQHFTQSGLVLHMPFENPSDEYSTPDLASPSQDASVLGPEWDWSAGYFGGAYTFEEGDYLVSDMPLADPSDPWSLETWFLFDDPSTEILGFEESGGSEFVGLGVFSDNTIAVRSDGYTTGSGSSTLSPDTWYHAVLVWDGTEFISYINGTEEYRVTPLSTAWLSLMDSFKMGDILVDSGLSSLSGKLDDVRIYDRVLTPGEISTNYEDGQRELTRITTEQTGWTSTGLNIAHNTTVYAQVRAINSAGLHATTISDGLIIDLVPPYMTSLEGSFLNATSGQHQSFPDEDFWVHATQLNFSWTAQDELSNNVTGYSYSISKDQTQPDNIPEGSVGSLDEKTSTVVQGLSSGKQYFLVKARDQAGNWGEPWAINISIDSSPPEPPEKESETNIDNTVTVTWSPASDLQSGIVLYQIEMTNGTQVIRSNTTDSSNLAFTFYDVPSGTYNISIGAQNGVGLWAWSDRRQTSADFDPPIIRATPNVTVVTNTPILKAWTDETAVCAHNITEGKKWFLYTNTTYHESRINALDGTNSYSIYCWDMSGNMGTANISFDVSPLSSMEITMKDDTAYRQSLTTLLANITDGSSMLAGIQDLRFELDDDEIDAEIFDVGDGWYRISFTAPDTGSYSTMLTHGSATAMIPGTLDVEDIYLKVAYSTTTSLSTDHIVYVENGDIVLGLATDEPSPGVSMNPLEITGIHTQAFLFHSQKRSMTSKENLLADQIFLDLASPTFGYSMHDKNMVHFRLDPDAYNIISAVGDEKTAGRYHFIVRKDISDTGIPQVIIENG